MDMGLMFETVMLVCFGLSWPTAIAKSVRSRTSKGKSLLFMTFVFIGYICGVISKVVTGHVTYVVFFYCLNACMVAVDIFFYFRNAKLDREADMQKDAQVK